MAEVNLLVLSRANLNIRDKSDHTALYYGNYNIPKENALIL